MEIKIKHLFKGIFSYRCEMEVLFAYAYTKEQARIIMCRRLAKKHDVHPAAVLAMFNGSSDNYNIKIEIEFKEDENEGERIGG